MMREPNLPTYNVIVFDFYNGKAEVKQIWYDEKQDIAYIREDTEDEYGCTDENYNVLYRHTYAWTLNEMKTAWSNWKAERIYDARELLAKAHDMPEPKVLCPFWAILGSKKDQDEERKALELENKERQSRERIARLEKELEEARASLPKRAPTSCCCNDVHCTCGIG